MTAGHRLTAEAGADVLRVGGTAYDAAIAAIAGSREQHSDRPGFPFVC